ncbi:cytochrome c biogenesis heme-transporting ATPase CcmA [Aquincola sp. S2]|uniref:Cytochrome c biogenesis heme-transporting ATPase CcmA n=1 Tax=Pseudaquabacterium terrae TaxID=2732868 RepID=A0ABX2EQY2_9BURK|nr:cytochrome c biogenesis heme-transporting ATPase CcmA [Aquabacterium terrae]NRF71067.1 cytochrome c biogenesis heme-transporting ATPase CcmA [Aquabacterium terrae]
MLTATDLVCCRGERPLFDSLSFTIGAGGWLHVKGENGAGKTTLLRTLAGLAPADRGVVCWYGDEVRPDNAAYRRALVYLGHPAALKDELTALENLALALSLDGMAAGEMALVTALRRVGLSGRETLPVRQLSAGQKRRVLLARLLLRPAALWLLDEPFAALDAEGIVLLCGLIGEQLAGGGIVVLTSHQPVALPNGRELQL